MYYLRKAHIIEGLDDEIIFAFAAFFGILIPMIMYVRNRRQPLVPIHPDNAERVQSTREIIQVSTRRRQAANRGDEEAVCPICLGNVEYGIETNCGHVFCGNCITTYWEYGRWLGAVNCPVCRQQVTLLLVNFTTAEENSAEPADIEQRQLILRKISDYNRRFSGEPRTVMEYLQDMPTLLRHAFTEFFSVGGLIWMFRLRIIVCFLAAFLYFISPLDIIPEAAFGILGFLDDFFILLLLAIYISIMYRQFIQNRAEGRADNPANPPGPVDPNQ